MAPIVSVLYCAAASFQGRKPQASLTVFVLGSVCNVKSVADHVCLMLTLQGKKQAALEHMVREYSANIIKRQARVWLARRVRGASQC